MVNPLDRSEVDPLEDVPVVGGMQMIPITRLDSTGGEDMFLLDLFVGEHVVTAQRFRFAIGRKSRDTFMQVMGALEWGSDIPELTPGGPTE